MALLPLGALLLWKSGRRAVPGTIPLVALREIVMACITGLIVLLIMNVVFHGQLSYMMTALPQWAAAAMLIRKFPVEKGLWPPDRAAWISDVRDVLAFVMIAVGLLSAIVMGGMFFQPDMFRAADLSVLRWHWREDMVEIALAVVAIPWLEEVLFRAGLMGYLLPRTGRAAAVLLSAALFSFMHMQGEIFWARGIAGVAMGMLYLRTGRIFAPFLLHAFFNSGIMLVAPLLHNLSTRF